MAIAGPLEASSALMTPYSPIGNRARGMLNSCGNGYTPCGTYLTCEENWPGYFTSSGTLTAEQERISLSTEGTRYGWDTVSVDEVCGTDVDDDGCAEFSALDTAISRLLTANTSENQLVQTGISVYVEPESVFTFGRNMN